MKIVSIGSLVFLAASVCPAFARADTATIVLVSSPNASALAQETQVRTRAELQAAGFTVSVVAGTGEDTKVALEAAAKSAGAVAAIAIENDSTSNTVDIWVSDRITNKISIRRVVAAKTADSPELVAIRTVELLRASLFELRDAGPSPYLPTHVPSPVERLIAPRSDLPGWRGLGIEIGAAALVFVDPAAGAVAPVVRLSYDTKLGVGARLTWIGPSFGPSFPGTLGKADLTEELAIAEILMSPPLPKPFELAFTAGTGVAHVSASGDLRDPKLALSGGATAFACDLGVDGALRFAERFAVDLGTLVSVAIPRVTIDMGSDKVGSVGRPTLGATLGVRAFF